MDRRSLCCWYFNPRSKSVKRKPTFSSSMIGKTDQKVITDAFLEQGVNVIRLPVTWTPFVDNETFKIDKSWLQVVKSEVDSAVENAGSFN